ncbi:MAG: hypothetical protein RLZZ512_1682 [Bacteroidota bacterium]|jgi:hypothetical protein
MQEKGDKKSNKKSNKKRGRAARGLFHTLKSNNYYA